MIALLAYGEGNREAVLFWRKGTGGEGRVGAGGIFEAIEVEEEFAWVVEAMIGKGGVEKAAGAVCCGGAGCVAEDEEEFFDGGILENRIETIGFGVERKFGGAGKLRGVAGADEGGDRKGLWRRVGNPMRFNAVVCIGRIPLQAVEAGEGGGFCVFDAQGEAITALDDVEIQRGDGHARIIFVVVGIDAQSLRLCWLGVDEESLRETAGWRI